MKITVREIRTFQVTRTTKDGSEISEKAACDAVTNGVLDGAWTVFRCSEVDLGCDLVVWEVKVEKRYAVDV